MKNAVKLNVSILFLVCGFCSWANAQDDYKFHCMFILNFAKYIQWSNTSSEFVIGVLGDGSVMPDLERAASSRMVNGRSIVVKRFSSSERVTPDCQMLYIDAAQSDDLNDVIIRFGEKILIVTAKNGLINKGSAINFVIKDGKWRFEINEKAAEKAKVKIGVELSRLGV